jgi:hypothetical protein
MKSVGFFVVAMCRSERTRRFERTFDSVLKKPIEAPWYRRPLRTTRLYSLSYSNTTTFMCRRENTVQNRRSNKKMATEANKSGIFGNDNSRKIAVAKNLRVY